MLSISTKRYTDIEVFDINADIDAMEDSRPTLTDNRRKKWAPKFDPRKVKVSQWRLKIERLMLKDTQLKKHGINISKSRANIKENADKIAKIEIDMFRSNKSLQ